MIDYTTIKGEKLLLNNNYFTINSKLSNYIIRDSHNTIFKNYLTRKETIYKNILK